jgi:hypothetical protein
MENIIASIIITCIILIIIIQIIIWVYTGKCKEFFSRFSTEKKFKPYIPKPKKPILDKRLNSEFLEELDDFEDFKF